MGFSLTLIIRLGERNVRGEHLGVELNIWESGAEISYELNDKFHSREE